MTSQAALPLPTDEQVVAMAQLGAILFPSVRASFAAIRRPLRAMVLLFLSQGFWSFAQLTNLISNAKPEPTDDFTAAVSMARDFPLEERAFFLEWLCREAAARRDPRTVDWAGLAFSVTDSLPPSWNRLALRKNVVTALSKIDAARDSHAC